MKRRSHWIALAVVWILILAYGLYFSTLSIQRHRAFLTNASDLGQIDQAIWNTLHGRPLEFTRRTGEESIRLTDHVEPIFVPAALVFLVYDNVEALLILQSFVIALGALPVFWIARRRLGASTGDAGGAERNNWHVEGASLAFCVMYLLLPSLEAANLAEFHAVIFVPVLMLLMYHYGTLKRWGRFALLAFLMLLVKEEIALLVATMAAYFVIFDFRFSIFDWKSLPRRFAGYLRTAPRVPMVMLGLAVLWFGLTYLVIIPHFNAQGKSPYTCRYLGGEDCPTVAHGLFLEQRLGYLAQLLASSGFVSLLDPLSLLLGSPLILANVLSNYPAQYSGTFHYSAPVAPYFVLAAIGGTAWLVRRLREWDAWRSGNGRLLLSPLGLVIAPMMVIVLAYHGAAGYTPVARAYRFPPITAHNALFERFAAQIPADARVATTPSLHPHLSHREFLYRYPFVGDAEYVLLDVNESDRGIPNEFRVAYNRLVNGAFGVVDAADGYVLLKRGAPKQNLPDAFFTPFRAARPTPQVPLRVDFDNKVRLLGYDVLTDLYGRGYVQTYWQRLAALDRNYVLFPFAADEQGEPVSDLNFPMTALFWYPSAAWKNNEVMVAKTVAVEWGDRVRLGVGVSTSFDWGDTNARLDVTGVEPSTLPVMERTWVDLGIWKKEGGEYRKEGQ